MSADQINREPVTHETASDASGAPTTPYWFGSQPPAAAPPAPPSMQGPDAHKPGGGRRLTELTAVALLAAVLASGGTYAATQLVSQDSSTSSTAASSTSLGRGSNAAPVVQANAQNPNWSATAGSVTPSVVAITAQVSGGEGEGSGVVIDAKGYILTNNHVVDGAEKLTVTLSNGHTYAATVKGTDPSTDLAVVALTKPPADLTPISLGDSSALKVGDPVMAVGNPLGLAGTVTTGIVSALNRPVRTQAAETQSPTNPFDPFGQGSEGSQGDQGQSQSTGEAVVTNAIQTSAAINPGNSGGALVNAGGQLIGINSSIASLGSSQSSQSGNIGIGFAIPINEAKDIATQLITSGSASHAYLGVTPVDGTAQDGGATVAGAKIQQVGAATPAAGAGLKVGDVVIAVGKQQVESADSLVGAIRASATGQKVALTVLRDGNRLTLETTLAARPTSTN